MSDLSKAPLSELLASFAFSAKWLGSSAAHSEMHPMCAAEIDRRFPVAPVQAEAYAPEHDAAHLDRWLTVARDEADTLRAKLAEVERERDAYQAANASLSSQVESMAMRIESLAEELAKPEDARLREVLDALEGRAVIFDGLGARVGHVLDEMDEWIGRAGEAERTVDAARRRLACVADDMTEHAYQELASALESPPRIAGKTAGFDQPGREYTAGDALGLRRDR